jgi:hypothetical protein
VLNLDALHIGGPTRDVMIYGFGNTELDDYVRETALLQGRETHPDPNPETGHVLSVGSFQFCAHRYSGDVREGGLDDSARGPAWGKAQLDDYMTHRYHQPSDQVFRGLGCARGTRRSALYYEVGYRVARSRRYPRWYPNSEFRTSRIRSPSYRLNKA